MKFIERFFESILWHSRLLIVVAVLASLLVAAGVLYMTTVDVVHLIAGLASYGSPALDQARRAELQLQATGGVVAAMDGYLLAAVLFIFSLGLYELYISKINYAEGSDFARRLLLISSLDDLKDRLARVILLILVVKFLQLAFKLKYESTQDLLFLAIGIILIGGAIYISHLRSGTNGH